MHERYILRTGLSYIVYMHIDDIWLEALTVEPGTCIGFVYLHNKLPIWL